MRADASQPGPLTEKSVAKLACDPGSNEPFSAQEMQKRSRKSVFARAEGDSGNPGRRILFYHHRYSMLPILWCF